MKIHRQCFLSRNSDCNISNYVPFVVPRSSTSSSTTHTLTSFIISITGYVTSTDTPKIQHQKEVEVRVEMTSGQKPHLIKNGRNIKCNTANYVPFVVPGLSTGSSSSATSASPKSVLQEAELPASTRSESTSSTVCVNPSHEPPEIDQEKHGDNDNVRGNRCVICQDGSKNLRRIWWMEVFQFIGTHPRVLLVNQFQSREEKWYRSRTSTVFCTHFPEGQRLRDLQTNQDYKGSLHETQWRSRTSSRKFW